jgi:predicted RNA binding protein YcfA (HicA-like mRNA interferase family)
MKVRDVLKMLDQDGWPLDRTRGSHRQFKHSMKPGLVTIAGKPTDYLGSGMIEATAEEKWDRAWFIQPSNNN